MHPRGFKEVIEDSKDNKREHQPRPGGVAVCHAPNTVEAFRAVGPDLMKLLALQRSADCP
jgi:hypothetical protein